MPSEAEFGDLTEKNIGLLRLLNQSIFPVRYNDKFYKDLLLPGREELTKLGRALCAHTHTAPHTAPT